MTIIYGYSTISLKSNGYMLEIAFTLWFTNSHTFFTFRVQMEPFWNRNCASVAEGWWFISAMTLVLRSLALLHLATSWVKSSIAKRHIAVCAQSDSESLVCVGNQAVDICNVWQSVWERLKSVTIVSRQLWTRWPNRAIESFLSFLIESGCQQVEGVAHSTSEPP